MQLLEISRESPVILFLDTKTKQKLGVLSLACPKSFVYSSLPYNLMKALPTWDKAHKPIKIANLHHSA